MISFPFVLLSCSGGLLIISHNFSSLLLEGTQMPQSRYLFAVSCFHIDLLSEAEAALCPANEPGAEV